MYRVSLAVIEVKVQVVQRSVTSITDEQEDYADNRLMEDIVVLAKGVVVLPDQLSSAMNAVGKVKVGDKLYVPKFGRDQEDREDRFIPQSQQVTYSNLRNTVVALANDDTPAAIRRRFYENNPIPGAVWEGAPQDPILANPDEIMPDGYDRIQLADDIDDIKAKINFLARKAPKYFTKSVSYEPEGTKSMLVCNDQATLRVNNRDARELLTDYYARIKVEGDINEYFNIERLTPAEQLDGNICLLGERPRARGLTYPVYVMRDNRVCTESSSLSYKAARNVKYT